MKNKIKETQTTDKKASVKLLFAKENYLIMLGGIVLITLGFVLMYGKEDIFSPVKITVAPLLVLAGFAVEFFAIFYKPKNGND
jgi:hypothetical protein